MRKNTSAVLPGSLLSASEGSVDTCFLPGVGGEGGEDDKPRAIHKGGGSLISRFSEVALINKQIPVLLLDLIEAVD